MGKVKELFVKWVLGGIVRDIAEGKKGAGLKRAYWLAAGWKTRTSAVAGLVFAALATWHPEIVARYGSEITFVIGVLVTAGLADADWKKAAPPQAWADALHQLMAWGAALSGLLFAVQWALLHVPGCAACPRLAPEVQWYAGAIAGVCTWLAARFAEPPGGMARRASDPQDKAA